MNLELGLAKAKSSVSAVRRWPPQCPPKKRHPCFNGWAGAAAWLLAQRPPPPAATSRNACWCACALLSGARLCGFRDGLTSQRRGSVRSACRRCCMHGPLDLRCRQLACRERAAREEVAAEPETNGQRAQCRREKQRAGAILECDTTIRDRSASAARMRSTTSGSTEGLRRKACRRYLASRAQLWPF